LKKAPFLYSFSLALVFPALADYDAVALLALIAAFQAEGVILAAAVCSDEDLPFLFSFF